MKIMSLLLLSLGTDEKLALSASIPAIAGLVHAFCYTAAEGAHPTKRWLFRRSADLLAGLGIYALIKIWV